MGTPDVFLSFGFCNQTYQSIFNKKYGFGVAIWNYITIVLAESQSVKRQNELVALYFVKCFSQSSIAILNFAPFISA